MQSLILTSMFFRFILFIALIIINGQPTDGPHEYYSIDGYGNNKINPTWGMAGSLYLRGNYSKSWTPSNWDTRTDLINARVLSNQLLGGFLPVDSLLGHNMLQTYWGQFLDHDITHAMEGNESWPIEVPINDTYFGNTSIHFTRSAWNGTNSSRWHFNQITAFLDLSQVYGSSMDILNILREEGSCRMRTSYGTEKAGILLPRNYDDFPMENIGFWSSRLPTKKLFLAGDLRANENPGLTSLHTIFLREHNRLCEQLAQAHPDWDEEILFWEARRWNIAFAQQITFKEYAPATLGSGLALYNQTSSYKNTIHPGIDTFFATVAFRYGHSEVQDIVPRTDQYSNQSYEPLLLRDCYYNPDLWQKDGVEPLILGMAQNPQSEVDLTYVMALRNFLFGQPGQGGFDLGARNIQRARDHQIPSYLDMRTYWGLGSITSFDNITENKDTAQQLNNTYMGNLSLVDAIVGGLAEGYKKVGSALGPMFRASVLNQYQRLRDGDRLYYESVDAGFSAEEVQLIRETRLSDIIIRNSNIQNIQCSVFWLNTHSENCGPGSTGVTGNSVLDGRLSFNWRVIGDEISITLMGKTQGWMAIGIPLVPHLMSNSDLYIFWVNTTGSKPTIGTSEWYVGGDRSFGCGGGLCRKTYTSVVNGSVTGSESIINGSWLSQVTFRRKLITNGTHDLPFKDGLTNLLLAYGNTDDFGYHGPTKASTSVTLFTLLPPLPLIGPAPMDATPEAWLLLFIFALAIFLSYILLIVRRQHFPLRPMSMTLSLMITTGMILWLNIPAQIIVGQNYPCWLFYWCYMLGPGISISPILVGLYRHRVIWMLEKMKKRLAKEDCHKEEMILMDQMKRSVSGRRLIAITVLLYFLPVIIAFCCLAAPDSVRYASTTNTDCHIGRAIQWSLLSYAIFYGTLMGIGLYLTRKNHEYIGYRRNITWLIINGAFVGFLFFVLIGALKPSAKTKDAIGLFLPLIMGVYQIIGILYPCIQTFPLLRAAWRAQDVSLLVPLSEIVVTRKGFQWFFLFCQSEFSQENPLCWKAIQNFKTKTSYNGMRNIFEKYFAPFAPLAVNISDRSVRILTTSIEKVTDQTPLEEIQVIFDSVQLELLDLMEHDSYRRFVTSEFYARYKRNENVPKDEDHKDSSTDPESSSQPKSRKASDAAISTRQSRAQSRAETPTLELSPVLGARVMQRQERKSDDSSFLQSPSLQSKLGLGTIDVSMNNSLNKESPMRKPSVGLPEVAELEPLEKAVERSRSEFIDVQ